MPAAAALGSILLCRSVVSLLSGWSVPRDGSRRLSAPAAPSDSGTEGSQAGRGQGSGATQPACRRVHDSAGGTADPGGGSKLQPLPYLEEKCQKSFSD